MSKGFDAYRRILQKVSQTKHIVRYSHVIRPAIGRVVGEYRVLFREGLGTGPASMKLVGSALRYVCERCRFLRFESVLEFTVQNPQNRRTGNHPEMLP